MGAIWDFISGKSTDWDAEAKKNRISAEEMRAYRETHPREYRESSSSLKIKQYKGYCKICGETTNFYHQRIPDAIRDLQSQQGTCGRNNHIPEIQEV